MTSSASLNLVHQHFDGSLWEVLRIVLHILLSVFISLDKSELEANEADDTTNGEVLLFVVSSGDWVGLLLALHETSTNSTRILVANLINLDSVVTTVERDDELSSFIIRLGTNKRCLKSKDMHVLLEHLLHVDLGGLWLKGEDRAEGVLWSSESIVVWNWLICNGRSGLGELEWILHDTHHVLVPLLGEVVTVIDEALSSVDDNLVATEEVTWSVELLALEGHTWAVSENWLLGKLLFLEEHWEWESTRVLCVNLLDFNVSVGEEVVQDVVLITSIVTTVLPQDIEAQHFPVVIKEAFQILVWSSTLEADLDVLLDLSLIGRSLLHIDHGSSVCELIVWISLSSSESDALVGKEPLGEVIAIANSEHSTVHIKVHSKVEVLPDVVEGLVVWVWELVPLEEDSLGNTGVLNSWLDDVDGIILEIVVDNTLSNSIVLIWILNHWLLEVTVEA